MKPDWATRLQRTFARKYDAGFAKGLMLGKAVATRDEQERIIKLLEAECKRPLDPKWSHYREECSCAQIALIKGEK